MELNINSKPSPELKTLAETVLLAKAWIETIKPIIQAIQQKHLEAGQYQYQQKEPRKKSGIITSLKDDYLMSEADFLKYYDNCYQEYIKKGFKDLEYEKCPLLIAENLYRKAVRAMLEEGSKLTGIHPDQVWNAPDALKNYDQLTELTLQFCAPYCDSDEVLKRLNIKKENLQNTQENKEM